MYNNDENKFDAQKFFENKTGRDINILLLYLNEIGQYPLLTKKETTELFIRLKNGDKTARNIIFNHNLRLVVHLAKYRTNNYNDLLDLIAEGNLGLLRAIDKYDINYGSCFSTYAATWIKQFITRYIENHKYTARIPVYALEFVGRIKKYVKSYAIAYHCIPTKYQVITALGINEKYYDLYTAVTTGRYIEYMDRTIYGSNDEYTDKVFGDKIEFCDHSIDDSLSQIACTQIIDSFKSILTEREILMLKMRYGYFDNKCYTLQEIGNHFGFTRERSRQIIDNTINKIRKYLEKNNRILALKK